MTEYLLSFATAVMMMNRGFTVQCQIGNTYYKKTDVYLSSKDGEKWEQYASFGTRELEARWKIVNEGTDYSPFFYQKDYVSIGSKTTIKISDCGCCTEYDEVFRISIDGDDVCKKFLSRMELKVLNEMISSVLNDTEVTE